MSKGFDDMKREVPFQTNTITHGFVVPHRRTMSMIIGLGQCVGSVHWAKIHPQQVAFGASVLSATP